MNKNDALKIIERVPKEYNFSFARNTTYGLGGNAKIAFMPKSIRQAIAVFEYLTRQGTEFVTIGNGSNILASDKNFDGAVISTKRLTGVYRTGRDTIFCRSGTKVSTLLKYCSDNGFGGLEYLAGIPATIGGIVYMNGGAGGNFICENVVAVKFFDGKLRNILNKYCNFGHKYSIMRDIKGIILGVELTICPENGDIVRHRIANYLEKRALQPKGANCGCVFKNAGETSAGKIIDEAGLKGLKIGGATVSNEHANFIINTGASSTDVYKLIKEVKRRVFDATGILLEEEVVYIGDF